MSLRVRVCCDGLSCTSTTGVHDSVLDADDEARRLTWLTTRVAGETMWFCPMHQRFDPRLQRWVAARAGDPGRRRRAA